jgi:hypothetical protein
MYNGHIDLVCGYVDLVEVEWFIVEQTMQTSYHGVWLLLAYKVMIGSLDNANKCLRSLLIKCKSLSSFLKLV